MAETFEHNVCAGCGGACCTEGLYITKKEYENLPHEFKAKLNCAPFMNGYRNNPGKCGLAGDNGCIIPENQRFLECKLFPFEVLTLDKLTINSSAKGHCTGISQFTNKDYLRKCRELLHQSVQDGTLTQDDVNSIRNNEYEIN